jgi:hypothetical protein
MVMLANARAGCLGTSARLPAFARLAEILEHRVDGISRERAVREGSAMSLDAAIHRALGDGKISVADVSGPLIPA